MRETHYNDERSTYTNNSYAARGAEEGIDPRDTFTTNAPVCEQPVNIVVLGLQRGGEVVQRNTYVKVDAKPVQRLVERRVGICVTSKLCESYNTSKGLS